MPKKRLIDFYLGDHDHKSCVETALQKASIICEAHDARFTPIRKRILELIWSSHKTVLAYTLLKTLREEKNNAEPPTVYRALDFLMEHRLIHKIESLNAYVGCHFPDKAHISQFMICTGCNQFAEIDDESINQAIQHQARKFGFSVVQQTVEVMGLCPKCKAC